MAKFREIEALAESLELSVKKMRQDHMWTSSLYIAASKSMFTGLDKMEKRGYEYIVKDPIVFRYVEGGLLIISKWGLEANDPELVVPELN
jgi:hypothetical protein